MFLKAKEMIVHASGHVKMTTYLEFPWPYCLFTMQLLWGYGDD